MRTLKNIPFDELAIGTKGELTRTLHEEDLLLFARMSGDTNPIHLDNEFAKTTPYQERIAHGMWTASLISCALATKMPGPGGIYIGQQLKFMRPVKLGDTVTVKLEVSAKNEKLKRATISTTVVNQLGKIVVKGSAEVKPSQETLNINEFPLPEIDFIS
ncbi:(R)-specific enoyl-CoA hydratase [invertebrate metagenome]|uniref:(R)-specific enoyl-CoA hydratase n=1 Tax=invertebrate metagenome TaxID=1711999 RepID=A0A2H9TBU9_9ZZZZ